MDMTQEKRRTLLVGTWCGVCAELVRVSTWFAKDITKIDDDKCLVNRATRVACAYKKILRLF